MDEIIAPHLYNYYINKPAIRLTHAGLVRNCAPAAGFLARVTVMADGCDNFSMAIHPARLYRLPLFISGRLYILDNFPLMAVHPAATVGIILLLPPEGGFLLSLLFLEPSFINRKVTVIT
jgi:hypothetical protein